MAQTVHRVPLVSVPQRFAIDLGGKALVLVSRWNDELAGWVLDVFEAETEAPLVICLPLVTGTDLLEQFRHIDLPGSLVVVTDGDADAPPSLGNLGAEANLYYVVTT